MKFSYLLKGVVASVFGAAMLLTGGTAQADYPCKEATFIVPYSPGGGSDQMARRLVPGLEEALGVGVNIVYKTGGGGAVLIDRVNESFTHGSGGSALISGGTNGQSSSDDGLYGQGGEGGSFTINDPNIYCHCLQQKFCLYFQANHLDLLNNLLLH